MSYRTTILLAVFAAILGLGGFGMGLAAPSLFTDSATETLTADAIDDAASESEIDTDSAGVSLVDTAGVLHQPTIAEGLEGISFNEPTRLVLFTQRGSEDSNFNERVLVHLRENHPELITEDGQKWTDGVVIIGIDPEGRHIGTYFGEDRNVSLSDQEDIQEEGADAAAEARWSDAMVDATERAAELVNRPTIANPGLWIGIGFGAAVLVGGAAAITGYRTHSRRTTRDHIRSAQQHYASVTMDMDATELSAATIPDDSHYGSQILERFRLFRQDYLALHEEIDHLGALTVAEMNGSAVRRRAGEVEDTASQLNMLDDVIIDTNTLLNLQSGWQRAWSRQTEPLREDLQKLDELTDPDFADAADGADEADLSSQVITLQEFQRTAEAEIERLGGQLQDESITPTDALDGLDALQRQLSEHLKTYYEATAAAYTESDDERTSMDDEMESAQRQRAPRRTILDSRYDVGFAPYWTAIAFSSGYHSGTQAVSSSRGVDGSGAATGYGAGGGSFSGAGSSSSF